MSEKLIWADTADKQGNQLDELLREVPLTPTDSSSYALTYASPTFGPDALRTKPKIEV